MQGLPEPPPTKNKIPAQIGRQKGLVGGCEKCASLQDGSLAGPWNVWVGSPLSGCFQIDGTRTSEWIGCRAGFLGTGSKSGQHNGANQA
eukprot:3258478-Amphidinium_carterae.1